MKVIICSVVVTLITPLGCIMVELLKPILSEGVKISRASVMLIMPEKGKI